MPTPALATLEQLRRALALRVPASAAQLAGALGVSVPTVHRLLARMPAGELVAAGKARRARYALGRSLRGGAASFPVYRVDRAGQMHSGGSLHVLHGGGSWMDLSAIGWPAPDEARDGWWPGLPYPLHQMRPQGYMGRQLAHAEHLRLGVPQDVSNWSDDDALWAITQMGSDLSGDLVVGERAAALWLQARAQPPGSVPEDQTLAHYEQQAERAVAAGVQGSSAVGEFPKFTAQRLLPGAATPHVIVKFSGADAASATVERWSDLLICEHLALGRVGALPGIQAARSRILQGAGRVFLEVQRFDRHGDFGRSPLCALDGVDAAFIGGGTSNWPALVARLIAQGRMAADALCAVQRLWWFGRLVANSDMHLGNLSLVPVAPQAASSRFGLAPVYDMLPMRFAPLAGGEVSTPAPDFALPLPEERNAWHDACAAALNFWREAAGDARISGGFRSVCAAQAEALQGLRARA